ncbi:efflux transporter periplasmic adaptor subunit [Flectobacillus sp. BAB-3569]|nr:efflux transporter periplasmic adaptor subunit [Flectobacillus sp. BAB-3569]
MYSEQVNGSNAALKVALANQAVARLEIDKIAPLVAGKVVSEIQLKSAQVAYESATAQVEQAKAALSSSRINYNFTSIKAPVSGYIGRIPSRLGSLVGPTDAIPLTTLSDIKTVYVYFSISEVEFLRMKRSGSNGGVDNKVELILADGSRYNQIGKVEAASGNIDRTTGSISMKAIFPNPNKLLRSGGACQIIINQPIKNIIKIPKIATKDIQDKIFVYKLENGSKVGMTPVEVDGETVDSYFIKSGIKAGDKIAVNRIDMLQMGVGVIPKIISIDSLK